MSTNKNAFIRYQALDKCLSNWGRRYYIEDLVEACNEALYNYNGETKEDGGVKKRQVQEDLNFLESQEGFGMLIDRIRDGHRVFYRYHDRESAIKDKPFNQEEMELIHDALMMMKRFEGVPQFEWIDELEKRLYTTSTLGNQTNSAVSFQHNPYLKGMEDFYKPIFDAIVQKRVIEITYHPFNKEPWNVLVSPYHLKQYNNRWFLIGRVSGKDYLSNYAIDRIDEAKETTKKFEQLEDDFSFDEYFSDIVGVSIERTPLEDVVLLVEDKTIGYIMTKPIHESQSSKPIRLGDGRWEIRLRVRDNYELRSVLRSYGSSIEVVSPESLREKMREEIEKQAEMYKRK